MGKSKLMRCGLLEMKSAGEKVAWVTAYDYPTAQFAEAAGMDMILVGDSLGMCVYGYESTLPVTMDQCIGHAEAVRRGARNTFVIGDMPFLSYQVSDADAVRNAGRFFQEAGVDAVKLEGGFHVCDRVRAINDAGMLVMGHIGLTPQSYSQQSGFKAQGRTAEDASLLVEAAEVLENAGAFALLVEAVPPEVCQRIRERLMIPVYGLGSGIHADGQLMISADILGVFQAFTPKFVKRYENLADKITAAFGVYVSDVKQARFPERQHTYSMAAGELEKLIGGAK